MAIDKSLISGNTDMLILKLLEKQDMYGYQMIEELAKQSDHTFELKAGTLYPLLHLLEQKQYLVSYDGETVAGKTRKYYRITDEETCTAAYYDRRNPLGMHGNFCTETKCRGPFFSLCNC